MTLQTAQDPGTALHEKRVLVVGGSAGIGASAVRLFREAGASVCVMDRDAGADVVADISAADACDVAMEKALARLGGLDALVITAGVCRYAHLKDSTAELWDWMWGVNVLGPALLCRAALPALAASSGTVTTVASAVGLRARKQFTVYGSTKAAHIHWCRTAAAELAEHGVRVNTVAPGPIDTSMLQQTQDGFTVDQWREQLAAGVPVGRVGRPDEVAQTLVWLSSEAASYVTGAVLPVDGGESL